MATIIAEYYTDELAEWNRVIDFNNREMYDFEDKLAEVIQRNTIPGIAARVEEHQGKLNDITKKFSSLQKLLQQQQTALKTDSELIDDTLINPATETRQNELRRNMLRTEKDYVDTKFACYDFLSGTLKK